MPPKKYAVKGEPDFHNINDERLRSYMDSIQQMMFAYKYHDAEKVKVLEDIWKELSWEDADRRARSAVEELERQEREEKEGVKPAPLLKKAPKMRKSPAKRKI